MDYRSADEIKADITAIRAFASSYRAYWGVGPDGEQREPVKDRAALRGRLHRQLPRIEKIMVHANTNRFGFKAPPIAAGAPPRIGVVAVAFADEDPVFGIGGDPCYQDVLDRLEITLGVLDAELTEAASNKAPPVSDPRREKSHRADQADAASVPETSDSTASAGRVFVRGLRQAWRDARAARRDGSSWSLERLLAAVAAIATIIATLGLVFGWWSS